jgi:hypothetical protein
VFQVAAFVGQGALRRGVTGSSLIIIASATTKYCAIDLFSQSRGLWRGCVNLSE